MDAPRKALRKMNIEVCIMVVAMILVDAAIWVFISRGEDDRETACILGGVGVWFFTMFTAPFIWMFDYERRKTIRVAILITEHKSITIDALASMMSLNANEVRNKVTWCFEHDLLKGYVIEDGVAHSPVKTNPDTEEHTIECPNCDATFTYVGRKGICPYCDHVYPPEKR